MPPPSEGRQNEKINPKNPHAATAYGTPIDIENNFDPLTTLGVNPLYDNRKGHCRGNPSLSYISNNLGPTATCPEWKERKERQGLDYY
jgi:hypothetical protein